MPADTPIIGTPKMPGSTNLTPQASVVPPGMGELNYIQTLLAGILDQSLYTTSTPTFVSVILSGLTASQLVGTDANKHLATVNVGTSLSLAASTLDAIQGIRTVDSPSFAGLTIGTITGMLKAASGVIGQATIGTSLSYSAPTLNAIQDIRTTATPQFARMGLGVAAESGYYLTARGSPVGVGGLLKVENTATGGWSGIHFFDSSDTLKSHIGWGNSGSGSLANASFFGSIANSPLHVTTNDTIRVTFTAAGLINCIENVSLGVADTNKSHYLRLVCGSDITADRNLTFTPGDAARTVTLTGNVSLPGDFVTQALYDAQTILAATTDNTPAALTIAEQTLVGRITGGNIAALTVAQVLTLLGIGQVWTTPGFNAANFTASGSMTWTVEAGDVVSYAYTYIGPHTMVVGVGITTSTTAVSASNILHVAIPDSKTATKTIIAYGQLFEDTTPIVGRCRVVAAAQTVDFMKADNSNWALLTNLVQVYGLILFEIN